ncbi:MAG: DUF481 domain-containing protein [Bdellovibrionales bacterium]|nr:DUF481 domain-containing protein [Bdellovibrionales bacterium]
MKIKLGFLVFFLVISITAFAFGQEEWKANAGFSGIVNTGNAENTTFGGNSLVSYKFDQNQFTWTAEGAYGRSKNAGVTQTNTKNWKTLLRYDRFVSDPMSIFTFGHIGQNIPGGFDLRYGAALGLAHYLLQNDNSSFKYEAGYDFTREERVGVADANIHSGRLYLQFTHKLNANVYFAQDVESLFNLQIAEDIRLNTLTSLNVNLTEKMAFQVGYQVRFDNQPVSGFKEIDTLTQMGLNVNFL